MKRPIIDLHVNPEAKSLDILAVAPEKVCLHGQMVDGLYMTSTASSPIELLILPADHYLGKGQELGKMDMLPDITDVGFKETKVCFELACSS